MYINIPKILILLHPQETCLVESFMIPPGCWFLIVVKFAAEVDPATAAAHFTLRRAVPEGNRKSSNGYESKMDDLGVPPFKIIITIMIIIITIIPIIIQSWDIMGLLPLSLLSGYESNTYSGWWF